MSNNKDLIISKKIIDLEYAEDTFPNIISISSLIDRAKLTKKLILVKIEDWYDGDYFIDFGLESEYGDIHPEIAINFEYIYSISEKADISLDIVSETQYSITGINGKKYIDNENANKAFDRLLTA